MNPMMSDLKLKFKKDLAAMSVVVIDVVMDVVVEAVVDVDVDVVVKKLNERCFPMKRNF